MLRIAQRVTEQRSDSLRRDESSSDNLIDLSLSHGVLVGAGLVVGGHGVVELVEERGVFLRAVLFGEAQGFDAFD